MTLPLTHLTCLLAFVVLTGGPLLHAGDKPPAVPEGYKPVKLPGGTTMLVKEAASDPFHRLSSSQQKSDKYDPTQLFNHENPMAHKQYAPSSSSMAQKDADPHDQTRYLTKSYTDLPTQDKNKSFLTKYADADPANDTHPTGEFNKTYTTASIGRSMPKYATTTSSLQGKEAPVGDNKTKVFSYTDASKQYLGPGAQKVPEGVDIKDNVVLNRMSDMPDRPLSVDEVKNLINHGIRPDLEVVNDMEPSKPLNSPDYKPEPLRDLTPPEGQPDRDAPVPPPGTMGNRPPENSEPLPQ